MLLCFKLNVIKEYVLWRLERKPVAADILIYKDNFFLYVSLYLIQIHISEPTGTKFRIRLPPGLEETVGHV
jgi:hypothetical protein